MEIVLPDGPSRLDAFVVEDETFDQKFAQPDGCPLAELGAARRANAIAHGENHVEVVVRYESLDRPLLLDLNY